MKEKKCSNAPFTVSEIVLTAPLLSLGVSVQRRHEYREKSLRSDKQNANFARFVIIVTGQSVRVVSFPSLTPDEDPLRRHRAEPFLRPQAPP